MRAKIVSVGKLGQYRQSSYWMLQNPKERQKCFDPTTCLKAAGELRDTPAGRRSYREYLDWLQENEPAQKQLRFQEMCRGWALGGQTFKKSLITEHREVLAKVMDEPEEEAREAVEMAWRDLIDRCLQDLRKSRDDLAKDAKNAPWKIAIAAWMKARTTVSNPWLAVELQMGHATAPSRYAGELRQGKQPEAARLAWRLEKMR